MTAQNGHSSAPPIIEHKVSTIHISPKQARFVDEYVIDRNGTRACIAAGYSETSAHVQSNRLLRQDKIKAALKAKEIEIAKRNEVSQDRVIQELKAIAFGEIGQQPNDAGVFDLKAIDEKIKLSDKLKALDQLAKLCGFNAPELHAHAHLHADLDAHETARRILGMLSRATTSQAEQKDAAKLIPDRKIGT